MGDKAGEEGSYGNLGNAYRGPGQFKTAIEYHQRHLEITRVYSCMMILGPVFNSTIGGRFVIVISTKVHTKVCGV